MAYSQVRVTWSKDGKEGKDVNFNGEQIYKQKKKTNGNALLMVIYHSLVLMYYSTATWRWS